MKTFSCFKILSTTLLAVAVTIPAWAASFGAAPAAGALAGDAGAAGDLSEPAAPRQLGYQGRHYPLYPARLAVCPDVPSPLRLEDGAEVVVVIGSDQQFALVPVTVENGTPLNYPGQQWGKGQQLQVDAADFPTLAATGRHSENELRETRTITGRRVSEITERGRPMVLSGAGFLAQDEDILSVLIGDNRRVAALGLKHGDLARPLFHIWNLLLAQDDPGRRQVSCRLRYHGKEISVRWEGSKGWQESLFDDEIQGR